MRSGSKLEPSARGLSPRVPLGLESYLGPVRHVWLYRIAPRNMETHKPYHDDNVGTQSAGFVSSHTCCIVRQTDNFFRVFFFLTLKRLLKPCQQQKLKIFSSAQTEHRRTPFLPQRSITPVLPIHLYKTFQHGHLKCTINSF